ncbi:MAG: VOC family protein [Actinomycetota bacterium]
MAEIPTERIVTKIIFPAADMAAAIAFYRGLGFEVESYDDGYAWVRHRGEEILHLARAADLAADHNRAAGYVHVQDVDAWHAAWTAAGFPVGPVEDLPWQMREFRITDPSGNLLRVGQNL